MNNMEIDQKTIDTLRELEESLWRAETRFDQKLMGEVFAKDFFEFGRSGKRWSRQELIEATADTLEAVIPLENFSVRLLSSDIAQVTYNSVVTIENEVFYGRRSSIWSHSSNGWQLRFHQGTPYDGNA